MSSRSAVSSGSVTEVERVIASPSTLAAKNVPLIV
jgi:hypothetical protein